MRGLHRLSSLDKLRMRISSTAGVRAWALRSVPERRRIPVSYTHLDVYKRQVYYASYLFPVRHFVEIGQNLLYGNYGYAYMWGNVACLHHQTETLPQDNHVLT